MGGRCSQGRGQEGGDVARLTRQTLEGIHKTERSNQGRVGRLQVDRTATMLVGE